MGALYGAPMTAASPFYYGFAPKDCDADEMTAIGTASNAFIEGVIRMDPALDPLAARLKGRNIIGVRCYLRADYRQKSKGFSCIKAYTGAPGENAVTKTVNFDAGWNEVYFDEPVAIGEEPVYLGYQVFETQGEPYPMAAYRNAEIPGACYINPARKGWEENGSHGALMIEAIVDGDDSVGDGHAIASPFGQPLVVAPGSDFECRLYIHNQSAEPLTEISYSGYDAGGNLTLTTTLALSQPLPPYGSTTVTGLLRSPSEEGSAVPLVTRATGLNGTAAEDCMESTISLYVSSDVFRRVPVIEEFTSQMCTNCPFMFYYLDMALEAFDAPHVYVAHHSGFSDDLLTQPCDAALLYLFGSPATYNPAVMYDRRVMQGCDVPVMSAASVASTEQYDIRIAEAMRYPALAMVLVDSESTDGTASCRVYGKISKAAMDFKDELYVTAYLLEDNIPSEGRLSQWGLQPPPEGAPEDLLERFRHRGVIRHVFNTGLNGDPLAVDSDGGFDVTFGPAATDSSWKPENCEVVAFVHKADTDNMADNYILNAGAPRFNGYASGITAPSAGKEGIQLYVSADGRISASDPEAALEVFNPDGIRFDASSRLPRGLYIVRWSRPDGSSGTVKTAVR